MGNKSFENISPRFICKNSKVVLPREELKFYFRVSDQLQLYALVELASKNHVLFLNNCLYWYQFSAEYRINTKCFYPEINYYRFVAKGQTPLLPLSSLDEEARITPDYTAPYAMAEGLESTKKLYEECKAEGKGQNE